MRRRAEETLERPTSWSETIQTRMNRRTEEEERRLPAPGSRNRGGLPPRSNGGVQLQRRRPAPTEELGSASPCLIDASCFNI